jgi:hypothetical protein
MPQRDFTVVPPFFAALEYFAILPEWLPWMAGGNREL